MKDEHSWKWRALVGGTGAGFQNIEVFVPTLELLACTKIFSKREKDLQDLQVSYIINL